MSNSPDIRARIYGAYDVNSQGPDDWHPSVSERIREQIAHEILAELSRGLTESDLKGLSLLLAQLITTEKRASAKSDEPTFNAD